ncbi:MAG TPA: hypothetical protein PLW50_00120 [Smithellaceae bacterium]|jgi:hypothetical protein|nr:hypothetical protein [Smithellaceae bacterium]
MRSKKIKTPKPGELVIVITHDFNKPMSMEEFVLVYLNSLRGDGEYVNKLFKEFKRYRVEALHKAPGKYASFRAIISEMNANTMHRTPEQGKRHLPYIASITPNRVGFEPSAYKITEAGIRRLQAISDSK